MGVGWGGGHLPTGAQSRSHRSACRAMMRPQIAVLLLALVIGARICVSKKDQDHYKILGIDKDATQREVRRAYRKLSVK